MDETDEVVKCDRCGEPIPLDAPTWIEYEAGRLRISTLRDAPERPQRAWHARCFGR